MSAQPAMHSAAGASVIINPAYRWQADGDLFYTAQGDLAGAALAAIDRNLTPSIYADQVVRTLYAQKNFGSGILAMGHTTIAWVDHIRTYPVYYAFAVGGVIISNDARMVLEQLGNATPDSVAALEFAMAGYVTGQNTLYEEIKCLLPGEVLIAGGGSKPIVARYYRYLPRPDNEKGRREAQEELSGIIDDAMHKTIARAGGRPIWVPLSAGLDSRIILCKLHELGYKNLHTFTYGPPLNFEALHAKGIARRLNVPWHYVSPSARECAEMFESRTRRKYSDFAHGYKAAASLREFTALMHLKERNILHKDSIIINGQTGDYLTGGHVSNVWFEKEKVSFDDLANALISRHYDLWQSLKTPENKQAISNKIRAVLPESTGAETPFEFAALEECWEYDERQATLVVNGQRSYDFFDYDWELPLWDRKLVDFFAGVPYEFKRGQLLYKQYLRAYNYKGLFPAAEPHLWRWPLPVLWVVPAARIIGLFSAKKKREFYALMRYYGHYSNQFAFFPFELHKRTYKSARNIFSLYVRSWFMENKFPLSSALKKGMAIDG